MGDAIKSVIDNNLDIGGGSKKGRRRQKREAQKAALDQQNDAEGRRLAELSEEERLARNAERREGQLGDSDPLDEQRRRQRQGATPGRASSILTSSLGVQVPPRTATRTLLG